MLLAWNLAEGALSNTFTAEALKSFGFHWIMAQIEKKKNDIIWSYTLIQPPTESLEKIFEVVLKVQKGKKLKKSNDSIEFEKCQDKADRELNKENTNTLDNCYSKEMNAKVHQEKPKKLKMKTYVEEITTK